MADAQTSPLIVPRSRPRRRAAQPRVSRRTRPTPRRGGTPDASSVPRSSLPAAVFVGGAGSVFEAVLWSQFHGWLGKRLASEQLARDRAIRGPVQPGGRRGKRAVPAGGRRGRAGATAGATAGKPQARAGLLTNPLTQPSPAPQSATKPSTRPQEARSPLPGTVTPAAGRSPAPQSAAKPAARPATKPAGRPAAVSFAQLLTGRAPFFPAGPQAFPPAPRPSARPSPSPMLTTFKSPGVASQPQPQPQTKPSKCKCPPPKNEPGKWLAFVDKQGKETRRVRFQNREQREPEHASDAG